MATLIADKYEAWKAEANARFDQLKANEEELNRIFAEIYNMVGEVPIEVEDKYVSVARIFDTAEEIPGRSRATSTCAPAATRSSRSSPMP